MPQRSCLVFAFWSAVVVGFSSTAWSQWTPSGTNIYNSNTGNVGVGTSAPAYKLDVTSGEARFAGYRTFFTDTSAQLRIGNRTVDGTWAVGINGSATDFWFYDFTTGKAPIRLIQVPSTLTDNILLTGGNVGIG